MARPIEVAYPTIDACNATKGLRKAEPDGGLPRGQTWEGCVMHLFCQCRLFFLEDWFFEKFAPPIVGRRTTFEIL